MCAQVELEAVRPGGEEGGEELRLGAAVLPLRLRVDQAVVEFLQAFFAPPNPDEGDGELINWADEDDEGTDDSATEEEEATGAAAFPLHAMPKSPYLENPEISSTALTWPVTCSPIHECTDPFASTQKAGMSCRTPCANCQECPYTCSSALGIPCGAF